MVVNRSNLHVGQTVFFVHKEYNSLTKMKEDSIVECKITKIGRVYITINNGYPNRQFFIKSGNDYEFGIQEKENAIDGGILCFTREDAEKHLLKKKMMLETVLPERGRDCKMEESRAGTGRTFPAVLLQGCGKLRKRKACGLNA